MPKNLTLNLLGQLTPQKTQTKLTLNIRNIDHLFPGFNAGDFAVIYGSDSIQTLTSILCIRAQLPAQLGGLSSNIVFIDGANTFRLYQVARLAQIHQLNPKQALERIYISRAFTAYQLTSIILNKLKETVEHYRAKLVIISDIASLFLDKDVPEHEAKRVFSQVTAYLSRFARENNIILIATCPPRTSPKYPYFKEIACARASVVISLNQSKYDREFNLEKHPHYILGTAEFPTQTPTLTDFMEPHL